MEMKADEFLLGDCFDKKDVIINCEEFLEA
jgi:hypothetical protein